MEQPTFWKTRGKYSAGWRYHRQLRIVAAISEMRPDSTGFAVERFRRNSTTIHWLRTPRNRDEDGREGYAQMVDRRRRRVGAASGGGIFSEIEHSWLGSRALAESIGDAFCEHCGIFGLRRHDVSTDACDHYRAGAAPQGTHRHSAADRSEDGFDVRAAAGIAASPTVHFFRAA